MLLFVACAVGLLASSAITQAQTIDKKVYFTFSGPVEIPGATLPAGKYLFHLADPDSGRQVLQVQSADGNRKVYGMFFSMPVQRPTAPDEAEVRFMETASGSPAVISTLWYAGERSGRELIYPRQQALRIARTTNTSVLTTKTEGSKVDDVKSGDLIRVSPSGQNTEFAQNSAAAEPAGRLQHNDAATADTKIARAEAPVATSGQARTRLPQTASHTPFLLMLAVGFFTATVALRLARTGWM